jgi:non-haem Fe2+, alpha-ketoglutarate-dependent halogenase
MSHDTQSSSALGHSLSRPLSSTEIDRYHRDGIVFPLRIFSEDDVAVFRAEFESTARNCGNPALRRFDGLHLFFGWAHRIASDDRLLNAVESILGNDILIDATLILYKPPGDSSYVSWHQDSVYSDWHLSAATSAWIALSPSNQQSGCMRVIPGSHQQGLLNHANVPDESNLLKRGERIQLADESNATDVVLSPGEISLHQSTIVHGSNPNRSFEPRIGFIVRFITSRIPHRGRPIVRVRGEGECSHLNIVDPPRTMEREGALRAWLEYDRTNTSRRE